MASSDEEEVQALIDVIGRLLPNPEGWTVPDGYPESLALCILDSIWSISVNYDRHVIPVLNRYRVHRRDQRRDPSTDGSAELLATIESFPSLDDFCAEIATRHRTSSRNGILKAEAVSQACRLMKDAEIHSAVDFRTRFSEVKADWHRVPGQRSGISWRYVLMLAGAEGVKADRMIVRFVGGALDSTPAPAAAERLMLDAADRLGVSARALDYTAWQYQRQLPVRDRR